MKHTNKQLKIGALALVAGIYSAGALSAELNGVAIADIKEPVTLTIGATMSFGSIASGSNATTVSVSSLGAVSAPAATGNAVVTNTTGAALTFTLQAANTVAYVLSIDDGVLDTVAGSSVGAMAVTNFASDATFSGTGAPELITVTGDLIVGSLQDAGSYSTANDTAIVITADYQ